MAKLRYTVTIRCSIAWWFKPYVELLVFVKWLTGWTPSEAHLNRIVDRAVTTSVAAKTEV
jgi:hypothetical protein